MNNQSNQNDVNQQNQGSQQPPQYEKRGNGLGVAAMVVGIVAIAGAWIPILNFVSVILGVIALGLAIGGLIVSRKGRPKGTSIVGLVLAIVTILIFIVMYGGTAAVSSLDNEVAKSDTAAAKTESIDTKDTAEAAPEEYFKDDILVTKDFKIEITKYKVIPAGEKGNEYGEKPVMAFWYKVTNLSKDTTNPTTAWIFAFKAIQDNDPNAVNQLNVGSLPDEKFLDSQLEDIKTNGTVNNAVAYELTDETTPVTLVATTNMITGDELGKQEYSVK